MKKGTTLTATEKMDRAREMTKRMAARELLYAAVFARLWPASLVESKPENEDYPYVLCVESPCGRLTWRISSEEQDYFTERLTSQPNAGEKAEDRTPILMALLDAPELI